MLKVFLMCMLTLFCSFTYANATEKIIYVPLDTRPITNLEAVEAVSKAGVEVIVPPNELLGTEKNPGEPKKLWKWIEENAPNADAAVLSTDSMIYGSLVASRKHTLTENEALNRVSKLEKLHEEHPNLKIYAYGTILRTLLSMNHSGHGMEPKTYQENAIKIYDYSALLDKREMGVASKSEVKKFNRLKADILPEVMNDWSTRHAVNWQANEKLLDLTKEGVLSFCLLGGDDSAKYSATHREARMLKEHTKRTSLDKTKFQVLSGADELGMIMLARAVLDMRNEIPFVHVIYNDGKGKETLPKYCFDTVENDIKNELLALGAMEVPNPAKADFTIVVNTMINGKTYDANHKNNKKRPNASTKAIMKKLKNTINKGYPVVVGDIAYANGSDRALLEAMRKEDLLFKIKAYGGWNTATNTLGFLLGTSALMNHMTDKSRNELMLRRYLDEWAYQANVRQDLGAAYWSLPGEADRTGKTLGGKRKAAEEFVTNKIKTFAKENINLPKELTLDNLKVTLPWNRFFECKIQF